MMVCQMRWKQNDSLFSPHNKPCHAEHCLHVVKTEHITIMQTYPEFPHWKIMWLKKSERRGHNQVLTKKWEALWKSGSEHTGKVKILQNRGAWRSSRMQGELYLYNQPHSIRMMEAEQWNCALSRLISPAEKFHPTIIICPEYLNELVQSVQRRHTSSSLEKNPLIPVPHEEGLSCSARSKAQD